MDDFYRRCQKKSADCTFTPEEEKEQFITKFTSEYSFLGG